MLIQVTLSKLRRNLGDMVSYVNITENRLMILKHGVARAALVTMADYEALYASEAQSLEYKEYNTARNLMRWQSLKSSLAEQRKRSGGPGGVSGGGPDGAR
ncbi:MAG: type II toxin-antitoxin system prevent-host-death family antitoxin, partial [Paracoccaceae bacterium]